MPIETYSTLRRFATKKCEMCGLTIGTTILLCACAAFGQDAATGGDSTSKDSDEARFWQSTEKEDYTIDREPVFDFAKRPAVTQNFH